MPNNVYIGSRYVPIFKGAWNNIDSYESLSIVEHGNNSYTSKRPVPPNTPPTTGDENDPYWALTGNYNGQIANLQQQINNNTSDITALTNDMASAEKAIDISDPIIFIGDSYADGASDFVALTIAELLLTNATNLAYGGDGFTWDMVINASGNGFLRQLQGYSGDKTAIKHIYVCGGLNDSQSAAMSALPSSIAAFRTYANANYPNAKLHLVFTGSALDGYPLNYGRTFEYRNKAKYIYSQADGFDYHDISGYLEVISTNIGSDGVHPSSDGQAALKNALIKLLLNMPNSVLYPYTRVGINASGSGSGIGRIDYCIRNNLLSLFFADNWSIKVPANTAITGDLTEVGTLTNMYFNRSLDIMMGCRIDKFNSKNFQNAVMLIRFFQDKIYVASKQTTSAGSGIETFTANLGDGFIVLPGQMSYTCEASTIN